MNVLNLILVLMMLSSEAFAQAEPEVLLTGKNVAANATSIIAIRTAQTPEKVTLELKIPFGQTVCEIYDTRMEFGADPACGYDTRYRTETNCVTRRVCEVSRNGVCQSYRTVRNCSTVNRPYTVMRSCYHPETYCARHGVATQFKSVRVLLSFKGLDKLAGAEQERFRISGRQNRHDGSNDKYSASVIDSKQKIDIKITDFLGDKIVFKKED